jgi:pyrimidine operon attenuation protein / uracil phosphoribosyltransferase
MTTPKIRQILDGAALHAETVRLAEAILKKNSGVDHLALIGMQRRGVVLARRLITEIERASGKKAPLGILDVSFYRDDFRMRLKQPQVQVTDIPFSIHEMRIVLVDDVLFTGRTVRAALDSIMDFGRPAGIRLAVLIDRGGRELPIQADFTGKTVEPGPGEEIAVCVQEIDHEDGVWIVEAKNNK